MEPSLDLLWSQVLERLQLQLSRPTFETWIKTAGAKQFQNNRLIIETPHPFARNWLQKYYVKTIADVLQDILGQPVDIQIEIAQGDTAGPVGESDSPLMVPPVHPEPVAPKPQVLPQQRMSDLNPKYVLLQVCGLAPTTEWPMLHA